MADERDSTQDKIQRYREIVLQYEKIDEEIDALIMASDGMPDKMPPEAKERYRQLAANRDELQNEMRWLERQLLDEEE
jgi:hypothetical protein